MLRIIFFSIFFTILNTSYLVAQNNQCGKISKELELFINSLKKQNYKIVYSNPKSIIRFESSNKSNQIEFKNLKGFHAKCKTEFKNNMYVRFNVYEICFNDISQSKLYEKKINEIINESHGINEKIYDFVIRNGTKLIYISTDARIFYESVLEQKNNLVKDIKNQR